MAKEPAAAVTKTVRILALHYAEQLVAILDSGYLTAEMCLRMLRMKGVFKYYFNDLGYA